jgi:hypothetical protein
MNYSGESLWNYNYDHLKNLFFQRISSIQNAYPDPKFPDLADFDKFVEVTKNEKGKIIEKYTEIKSKIVNTANQIVILRMGKIMEKQIK